MHWGTFIAEGHDLRDALGIEDEDEIGSACYDKISEMWHDPLHQGLRRTHVTLLSSGELL